MNNELEQIERAFQRRERTTTWISNALLIAAVACTIPLTIIAYSVHDMQAIRAAAEDDCPYHYGTMSLDSVESDPEGGVICIYRGL